MLSCLAHTLPKARLPGQVVIQLTDRCNARCPQCGMRVSETYSRATLSVRRVKQMLVRASQRRVQAVSFTGGEPLLYLDEVLELTGFAAKLGIPFIRTGTNGFLFRHWQRADFEARMHRLAERLAATPLRNFWISLDSADTKLHEEMRGFPGVVRGIAKALPIFHAHGIYPSANLGINRYMGGAPTRDLRPDGFSGRRAYLQAFEGAYHAAFARFYQHILDLGFTMVNTCYPMSIGPGDEALGLSPVYAATAMGDVVHFAADEKAALFRALLATIPEFRAKLRIFSPLCALYTLARHYSAIASGRHDGRARLGGYGCRGGLDFWFVDASNGHAYPCGYRGAEDHGPFEQLPAAAGRGRATCDRCDWECFRDPSELFGPLLEVIAHPLGVLGRLRRDPQFFAYWRRDIAYYRACGHFDGRKPPRSRRMARFLAPGSRAPAVGPACAPAAT